MACSRRASFSVQSDHRPHSYGGELYLQAARTSFQFPLGSDEFSIDALGTRGSIRFTLDNQTETQAEDLILGRHIKVDITAFSDDWLGFERAARICQSTPHLTETGYTSEGLLISAVRPASLVSSLLTRVLTYRTKDSSRLSEDRTAFDIVVRFPTPAWTSRPLLLPNISASMYGFTILVDDTDGYVSFDSVFLRSMGKPIRVGVSRTLSFSPSYFLSAESAASNSLCTPIMHDYKIGTQRLLGLLFLKTVLTYTRTTEPSQSMRASLQAATMAMLRRPPSS